MLYEYLINNYKPNEPIFTADIEIGINRNSSKLSNRNKNDKYSLSIENRF